MSKDCFMKHLQRPGRLRGGRKTTKKHIILATTILALGMGLFFYSFFGMNVYAEKSYDDGEVLPEHIDPLNKIGMGVALARCKNQQSSCREIKEGAGDSSGKEKIILSEVSGHPIEEMIPHIRKRNDNTAAFLVAIAKKESNWGKYSPQKNGRTCYNYWGYRGSYNQTASGYSCFDSPEQAIREVGDRIENLINQSVDTPEEMIVWKCGATCAGHNPEDVRKWISDVKLYYDKINS